MFDQIFERSDRGNGTMLFSCSSTTLVPVLTKRRKPKLQTYSLQSHLAGDSHLS